MKKTVIIIALFLFGSIFLYKVFCSYATNNKISNINQYKQAITDAPVYIRIFKQENKLEIWQESTDKTFSLYKTYPICYYSGGLGPKKKEGDKKSPEGFYYTQKSLLNPNSRYHLSFNIGYPNEYDKSYGYTGSFIMVHGRCVSVGCYAMTDDYIEEIYSIVEKALDKGQTKVGVHIFPFEMTDQNMETFKDSEYYSFWQELKPAYDYFSQNKVPPNITVIEQKYSLQ